MFSVLKRRRGSPSPAFAVFSVLTLQSAICDYADALTPVPPALHVPHTAAAPKLTGVLDDPVWKDAAITPNMSVSLGPSAQGLTALPTQAYLLWDATNLYIRFVCIGGGIQSPYTQHDDPLYRADAVEVFIDPKGDGHEWIELEVSPNNVVFDQLAVLTTEPKYDANGLLTNEVLDRDWWTDLSWRLDGLRTATGRTQSDGKVAGWIVDMAIPANPLLRRLGVKSFRPMDLRVNLLRYETVIAVDGKSVLTPMNWAPVMYGCPHISPDTMGTLVLDPPTVSHQ